MVLPVTGPFITRFTNASSFPNTKYERIETYRQRKPYDRPLPHTRQLGFGVWDQPALPALHINDSIYGDLISSSGKPSNSHPRIVEAYDEAYQLAYDRFVARAHAGATASLGVSLAEAAESVRLITKRAKSLTNSVIALRRKDLGLLYRSLFLNERDRKRAKGVVDRYTVTNDFSSAYLELVFGWRPLINDIGNAVEVLQSDFRTGKLYATGLRPFDQTDPVFYGYATGDIRIKLQSIVSTSNPNVRLANQLGFVNPVQVAWDVIPFSFIVNWFLPVSQFLGSFSSLWGMEVKHSAVSYLINLRSSYCWFSYPYEMRVTGYKFERTLVNSFVLPNFVSRMRMPGGDNLLGKAISSIALLTNSLTSANSPKRR